MSQQSTVKKTNNGVRFLALCLAVLLASSILIWGFQSAWGDVTIKRLTLTTPDGEALSTLIYIPKTATKENPAPCAIIYHGRSNQGHSNDTWSMELARRGYVVLSPDLTGGGESHTYDSADGYGGALGGAKSSGGKPSGGQSGGQAASVDNRTAQGLAVAEYALTLDIVEKDKLNLIGYSLGTSTAVSVASEIPEKVNSVMNALGPFMVVRSMPKALTLMNDYGVKVGMLKADADQYDFRYGDFEAVRKVVSEALGMEGILEPETDIPFGEGVFRYNEVFNTMHQTGNISGDVITAIIKFENDFNQAPVTRADSDQAWLPQQIFSGVACVTMMFTLAALLNLLMQTKFFGSMAFARAPRKETRGWKAWAIDILFSFAIPALLFIRVSTWGMNWFGESKILTSSNLNGIMLWLVIAMALIGLIRTVIKAYLRKKKGETIALSDYCLAPVGGKFQWSGVGKGLLMGLIVAVFFGVWMTMIEGFLGINYQVWNLSTYLKPSPERIVKAIPYMIIIFAVMFLGNINQRVLPSTGNERKDMWIAVTVNTVLTASALFFLLVVQYGGSLIIGTGETPFKGTLGSVGALDFAFGYCYMMGGSTGVVTYLYRKYGNILAGVIPCSIFCGLFTLIAFTLVR